MSDSEILLDSDGCEVRSEDGSDSAGSLADFITYETDSDPDWIPRKSTRLRKKPMRFADEVFETESEEEDSDDDTE